MIECYFCGRKVPSMDAAIEDGWIPSFVKLGEEYESSEPVCAECVMEHLQLNHEYGDFEEIDGNETN